MFGVVLHKKTTKYFLNHKHLYLPGFNSWNMNLNNPQRIFWDTVWCGSGKEWFVNLSSVTWIFQPQFTTNSNHSRVPFYLFSATTHPTFLISFPFWYQFIDNEYYKNQTVPLWNFWNGWEQIPFSAWTTAPWHHTLHPPTKTAYLWLK